MTFDPLDIRSYDYDLPDELIASAPAHRRSSSRLLLVDPGHGTLSDGVFTDVAELLGPDDLLVVNDARVSPARLSARRDSGGAVEVFVVGFEAEGRWQGNRLTALTRSNRTVAIGEEIQAVRLAWLACGSEAMANPNQSVSGNSNSAVIR